MFDAWLAGVFGLVDTDGAPVALAGVEVRADVVGRGVKATLTQRFVNAETGPVEAVYRFPLPEGGAVCGFRVRIDDRVIESVIEERDKAFRRYDDALADGHGGYLLDEERPNIFTVSVGNLPPGTEVMVEVDLVGLLEATGSRVRLYVPTTIAPRYTPQGPAGRSRQAPDGPLTPPSALGVPYGLRLDLRIHDADTVAAVTSPSHDLTVDTTGSSVQVALAADSVPVDRDLVIDIDHHRHAASRGRWCTVDADTYVLLDLALPDPDPATVDRDREVVFIIDCSGSMMGTSIDQARQAMTILLRSLPERTRFNVLRFGTTYQQLFPTPKPYTPDSVRAALDWVDAMDADLGGTEMLPPLQAAMTAPPAVAQREVFLLTDGEIDDDEEVVRVAGHHRATNRVFTVGIGHGPNEYLIRQLARTTGGLAVTVAPGERLEPAVLRLFNRAMSEPITHLHLAWPHPVEQAPSTPAAHLGETVSITARTTHPWDPGSTPGGVTLTGRAGNRHLTLDVPLDPVPDDRNPLPQLWARQVIRDLEEHTDHRSRHGSQQHRTGRDVIPRIIEISRRFRVLSRHTSFLAIETRHGDDRNTEPGVLRPVPTMLTHDWHGLGWLQHTPTATPAPSGSYKAHNLSLTPPRTPTGLRSGPGTSPAATPSPNRQETPTGQSVDALLDLLSLQHHDGGFPLHPVADLARIPATAFAAAVQQATASSRDGERLVATALALAVLHTRYPGHTTLWAPLIRKSERWLTHTLTATPVAIDSQPLQGWARGLVTKSAGINDQRCPDNGPRS